MMNMINLSNIMTYRKVFSDESIIAKINKNSTLEELYNMYNKQIETGTGQAELLRRVLLIIKRI